MIVFDKQLPHHRKYYATLNGILAFLIAGLAVAIIILLYIFSKDGFMFGIFSFKNNTDTILAWIMVISFALIQVAICGGAVSSINSRPLAYMYGGMLLPVWIAFLMLSLTGNSIYSASTEGLKGFCPTDGSAVPNDSFHTLFQMYTTNIDSALVPSINKWMCSS